MITAMRKGELLAIDLEDEPFDFYHFSHEDEFPAEWIFDDKNLKDIDEIMMTNDRYNKQNKRVAKFEIDPRFKLCIISTCKDEDLEKIMALVPHIEKMHCMRICMWKLLRNFI